MNIEEHIQNYYKEYQMLSDKAKQLFDPLTKYVYTTNITVVRGKGWGGWLFRFRRIENVPLQIDYVHRTNVSGNVAKVVVYIQKSYCHFERIVESEEFTLQELTEDNVINQTKIYNFISKIIKLAQKNVTEECKKLMEVQTP